MQTKKEASNSLPAVFSYGEKETLRTMVIDNQPWMVAKDVCNILEIVRANDALRRLDEDEKLTRSITVFGRKSQMRKMWLVNESGLYNLVFLSRKPEAKAFRKWVTNEVLPRIRQTGSFVATNDTGITSLNKLADKAAGIAGSYKKLAMYLRVSKASFTILHNDPQSLSLSRINRLKEGCEDVVKYGIRIVRADHGITELLMQIEDKDLRVALWNRLKKGGLV